MTGGRAERAGVTASSPGTLAEFRLLRELGAGSMGRVYEAERGGDRFALKVLHPHLLSLKGFFRRFQREALAGSAVRHENVVHVFECDLVFVDGAPCAFLVMELVEGRTLRELLVEGGRCSEALARDVGRQAAGGLAAIHAADILHRDIKPENLLLGNDGRVRVMDLGVARLLDASTRLTADGHFAGSLLYASPEQLRGGDPGPASDLYALGVVLHEMLTGANPFRRPHPAATMEAHLADAVPWTASPDLDVSPFMRHVVATLLEKRPADRFPSAALLRDVLAEGERAAW